MMKRLMFLAVVAAMLSVNSGCYLLDHVFSCGHGCGFGHGTPADCDSCGSGSCGGECSTGSCGTGCGGCASCGGGYASGPDDSMGGAVTYPYYANRGPRDVLAKSPRSIGP
jgi:hypothetical protein